MAGAEEGSDMPPPPVVNLSKPQEVHNDPVTYSPPDWSSIPRYDGYSPCILCISSLTRVLFKFQLVE